MDTDRNPITTPQEEALIEHEFQDLLQGYINSNHRKKVEIIERAFRFAKKAHGGIRRRSGEPYILHPIAVAKIASREIGLGSTSICAALLHDVVEDTEYTVEDISSHFGPKIAELVSGLTKISGGIFGDKASLQAENFRKLLLTMSEDIRVVLIKMADRLHNMRTLGSMAPNKQYKIAGETLGVHSSTGDTLDQLLVGHVEGKNGVNLHSVGSKHLIELVMHYHKLIEERSSKTYHLSLRNSSRETVQNETLLASRAVNVILDDVDHDIVAHESSGIHGLLSTQTVLSSYQSN